MSTNPITITLDSSRAGEFIQRLATDTGYRDLLEENPEAALAEVGIQVSPELIPAQIELPSQQQVEAIANPFPGWQPVPLNPCLIWSLVFLAATQAGSYRPEPPPGPEPK